jgi:hypothetical protein
VALRVALFVEGSASPPPPRGLPALARIWAEHLCGLAGVAGFSVVVPISKKHIVAMDPSNPKMSGAAEPLDQLIARRIRSDGFDAAVVAWDLVPAWSPSEAGCRWTETLDFYGLLAQSGDLPSAWVSYAEARFNELGGRQEPGARSSMPTLERGACVALCMDPMFEHLLVGNERAVKRALGITGRLDGWPRWSNSANPDKRLLAPAIAALPRRSPVRRRIRGDFRTHKDEWGEYLLRQMLADDDLARALSNHPWPARLREIMQSP